MENKVIVRRCPPNLQFQEALGQALAAFQPSKSPVRHIFEMKIPVSATLRRL